MDTGERLDALTSFAVSGFWHTLDVAYVPQLDTRQIACPICGHRSGRGGYLVLTDQCQFGGGLLERYACPDCDFIFGPLKMLDLPDDLLTLDYQLLYDTYNEGHSTPSEVRTFHATRPRREGLYLDWGCGARSDAIDTLRAEGWEVWGFEPAVRPESPFIAGSEAEISATFDGLFSNNVIEHFRDPITEFRRMASHLAAGSLMTHATPCYDYEVADTRFHTAFYLGRSVDVLAERVGLEVLDRDRDGQYVAVTFRVL